MKKTSKVIAMILAIISIVTMFSVCASAASVVNTPVNEYEIFVSKKFHASITYYSNEDDTFSHSEIYSNGKEAYQDFSYDGVKVGLYYDGKNYNILNEKAHCYYKSNVFSKPIIRSIFDIEKGKDVEGMLAIISADIMPLDKVKSITTVNEDGQLYTVYNFDGYSVYMIGNKMIKIIDAKDGTFVFNFIETNTAMPIAVDIKKYKRVLLISTFLIKLKNAYI